MASVCVKSRFVLHATLRSAWRAFITNTMTNCHTGNESLEFLDGDVHPPDGVNASESDEPVDEPVSDILDSCTERPLLSQRQFLLIYHQLRKKWCLS